MNVEASNLETLKQQLILRSEQHRQQLRRDIAEAATSVDWIPRTLGTLRYASPLLLMAAPAIAFAAGRWVFGRGIPAAAPIKSRLGLFGKLLGAVRLFQQLKPLFDGFRHARQTRTAPHI